MVFFLILSLLSQSRDFVKTISIEDEIIAEAQCIEKGMLRLLGE